MAKVSHDDSLVNARILYWGAQGSGKTENLRMIYSKLRPDHRGSIEAVPTRIDPTVEYEVLPIRLGDVGGFRTAIEIIAVPGAADQSPTRKQLLDEVDGIVLVVDSRAERIDDNEASLRELRDMLVDYGRRLEDIPLVVQYNKRDLSNPYTLDELHRRLDVGGAAVFEAVATEATGVLKTLSTLSKRVVRTLRDRKFDRTAQPDPIDAERPASADTSTDTTIHTTTDTTLDTAAAPVADVSHRMEEAILAEASHPDSDAIVDIAEQAEILLDDPWDLTAPDSEAEIEDAIEGLEAIDSLEPLHPLEPHEPSTSQPPKLGPELSIASVGEATRCGERAVRVPLVVADKKGRSTTLVLTISLDTLSSTEPGVSPDTAPDETPD